MTPRREVSTRGARGPGSAGRPSPTTGRAPGVGPRPPSRRLGGGRSARFGPPRPRHPDLAVAAEFANAIHSKYPGKLLAYNCSPSFNWSKHLTEKQMESFREDLAALGYKFQFITLAGFHALNTSMFELSMAYKQKGMAGFSQLQQREFGLQAHGFKAVKHQSFVGTGYFDYVQNTVQQGMASTVAMKDSTEAAQFH